MSCTARSASNTGMPCSANSRAVWVLPMPIAPVRPTIKGLAMQGLHQPVAQALRDLGPGAEKSFEGGRRLMHQHPQSIDGQVSPRPGVLQQLRLKRMIDDV